MDGPMIRLLPAAEAEARLEALGALLEDAVAHGASVNFLAGLAPEAARGFWRRLLPALAAGEVRLLVAEADGALLGTVLLFLAAQPNAPHRGEIGKMLVHSAARRRGLGRRLLGAAEAEALRLGRTLLLLDTETGSAGDRLYRACGWQAVGVVPDHAYTPAGRLAPTTIFCKALAPHAPRPAQAA